MKDICKECGETKDIAVLIKSNQRKKGYQNRCYSCRERQWDARREWINEVRGVPCKDCGRRFPSCAMDFDHLPQYEKKFGIMSHYRDYPLHVLEKEIAKCEIVCACCHRIRTTTRCGRM